MSSNDHKKFKTDATQKTSTDTEIISDTVLLPPYSTDHVLTVTAPSSTSGLTGQVDVELEMSPDGENWCPALTEETTAGGGGTSGVSAEDANLNAVATLPDPGANNVIARYTGNKFALGSLSYDDNGNELTTAGTGTRDFMHQFMSKDKPFNYSMWLKTDTGNHPFQSGYTHTLFRHGGKDKFTNENVIQTDSNTTTQNLCTASFNSYAVEIPSTTIPQLVMDTSSSHINPFKLSTDTGSADLDLSTQAISISFNIKVNSRTSSSHYDNKSIVRVELGSGVWIEVFLQEYQGRFQGRMYSNNGANYVIFYTSSSIPLYDGNWHHVIIQFNTSTTSNIHVGYNYVTAFDGVHYSQSQGTPGSALGAGNYPLPDGSSAGAFLPSGYAYDWDGTVTSVSIGGVDGSGSPTYEIDYEIDNLCFWRGNHSPDTTEIYNKRNDPLSAVTTNCVLKSCFTMGDGNDDRTNVILKDIVEPSSGRQFVKYDYSNNTVTHTVTVANLSGYGNRFLIDGTRLDQNPLFIVEGDGGNNTYIFDQSDSSNSGHPLRFSTTQNGTHGGGVEYTTGVTVYGTPGTAGAYTQISLGTGVPTLYAYCSSHTDMGGRVETENRPSVVSLATAQSFPNLMLSVFSTGKSSSISGWFKTTDTGTLFSNRDSSQGLKVDITSSGITITHNATTVDFNAAGSVNDGEWHHFCLRKYANNNYDVFIDNVSAGATYQLAQANTDWNGSNGFTLLSDGDNNAVGTGQASTDSSKLTAALSNWSLHRETFTDESITKLYSNGHVRNLKNLAGISLGYVIAWWQFNDTVTPEQDPIGSNNLLYQDGGGDLLTSKVTGVLSGPVYIVEEDQYGSGITMTLTKRFDTVNNIWTDVHTHPTCICLSFNGLEDQAEYFAIYTSSEIDVANNQWHNLILSFSGKEGSSTSSTSTFSFRTTKNNFVVSIDGNHITEAHFVGGLGLGTSLTNKEFTALERHLKWDNNSEEDYMPHAQLNSNIFESIDQATNKYKPVKERDYSTGFLGYADDTSFHSESWFTDANFTAFNGEKARTMFGNTGALSNRGVGSDFPQGTPYPLRRPSVIGSSTVTLNQYIDPEKYDASTNPDGGLEAWWRWGDTTGDCTVNINNAIGFESGNTDTRRSLNLNSTYNSEPNSVTGEPEDLIVLSSSDSIYVPEGSSSTGSSTSLVSVILENIQAGVCNLKNLTSPILQYIRVKYTNSGEAQLGKGKLETSIHYRRRRER